MKGKLRLLFRGKNLEEEKHTNTHTEKKKKTVLVKV